MATTTKLSDVGWIYHAPAKPKDGPTVTELPPASQIPGLNEFPEGYFPPEEQKKLLIHEHDSPYIRLAKQGGRPDLLRQRTPKERPQDPKPYPRVDWFYQDDIKMEEDIMHPKPPTGKYEFALPDYMVHQEYKPYGDAPMNGHSRVRNIMSRDQTSVFEREGHGATDKTVRLEEKRPSGYGVRCEKKQAPMPKMQPIVRGKAPEPELQTGYAKLRTMPVPKEEDRPMMSKLLSFGYAKDWEEQREDWETKHPKQQSAAGPKDKTETEYQANIMGSPKKPRVPSHGRRAPPSGDAGSAASSKHRRQKAHVEEEKPDFFSLSKFQNTPAKANTRRTRSELQPASVAAKH